METGSFNSKQGNFITKGDKPTDDRVLSTMSLYMAYFLRMH